MRPTTISRLFLVIGLGLLICLQAPCQEPKVSHRWEKTIEAFEKQDEKSPPPKNAVVFVGSSSIRLWDLKKSFPSIDTVNRGFGGSEIADAAYFAPRIVNKYEPRLVVFYAGDNDLAAGKSPEQLLQDFKAFVKSVQSALPKTKILFLSVKPSPSRKRLHEAQQKTNRLIEEFCKSDSHLLFVDVGTPLLGADGAPRREFFRIDGLHLNEAGYDAWNSVLNRYLKQDSGR